MINMEKWKEENAKVAETIMAYGRQQMVGAFKTFFDAFPDVDALRWSQFTPYFNDGDVCEFSRNEFDVRGYGDAQLVGGQEMDEDGFYQGYEIDSESDLGKALDHLYEGFADLDETFRLAFGDHVRVTATRKGFTVESYDHE